MQIVRKNLAFYGAKLFDAHDVLMKMHKRYIKFDEKPTEYMGLPWDGIPYESDWLKNRIESEFLCPLINRQGIDQIFWRLYATAARE